MNQEGEKGEEGEDAVLHPREANIPSEEQLPDLTSKKSLSSAVTKPQSSKRAIEPSPPRVTRHHVVMPSEKKKYTAGKWQKNAAGRPYRCLEIDGVAYVQWDHTEGGVVRRESPDRSTQRTPNPRNPPDTRTSSTQWPVSQTPRTNSEPRPLPVRHLSRNTLDRNAPIATQAGITSYGSYPPEDHQHFYSLFPREGNQLNSTPHSQASTVQRHTNTTLQHRQEDLYDGCDPPSKSTRTSGKLQDNQQSRREQAEQVDPRYQVVLNPKRYFKLGRVFMTLWTEPKGNSSSSDGGVQAESDHVKVVFREIRHFVVVRAKAGHCLCVPISTYRGQGTLKHTARPAQDHAVIVVFGDEPQLQPGERELTKQPLKVICEDLTLQKLHPASRINFGKVYTIEYNIRVRTFGRIATESLPLLQKYFLDTIVGTRDADEDTLLHSKRDASRSPDQSAHALDAEPFRTPTLPSAADHTVSQHAKFTYVPPNGHERRHNSYATPTGASARPSVAHKPSISPPQSLDSRSSTLFESSEEQTRTSNPRAPHGPQSAKISSNADYQVPQLARLQVGRTGPRQAAENEDEFRLPVILAGIGHALEQSRYTESDSPWGYGAGGNNTRPPPATRHSTTGRTDTLSSVDDDSPLNLLTNNQPHGGAPSIVERTFDLRGTGGDRVVLDHRYYVRKDGVKFFTIGRVFALLWHESARAPQRGENVEIKSAPVIAGRFGEPVFSRILRLAVVKENHGFCWCIPINTYNGQGVLKKGFNRQDQEAHVIIHMDNTAPGSTSEEEKRLMAKKPIAVHPAAPNQKLNIMSRLNFAKIYTVEWNVKVMNVGEVTKDSMPLFIQYWRGQLE